MANAVFVAPFLLPATVRFIAAAASLPDVRLGLISQDPEERLPDDVRAALAGHYRVADGTDAQQIADATRVMARHLGSVDCLLGMLEQLQVPLGEVRDALGIPGMGAEVAHNFRDKARMKTVFEASGVPCARHRLAHSAAEARTAAAALGYPLVAKPPAGAGARSTFRIDGDAQLEALARTPTRPARRTPCCSSRWWSAPSTASTACSSMASWSGTRSHAICRPRSRCSRTRGSSGRCSFRATSPARSSIPSAATACAGCARSACAPASRTWSGSGDATVRSRSARSPRVRRARSSRRCSPTHTTSTCTRRGRASRSSASSRPPERRYAVGAAYLRGQGSGAVVGIHGLDILQRELGDLVVEAQLPREGQQSSGTYEGEGHVILRHPETAVVEAGLAPRRRGRARRARRCGVTATVLMISPGYPPRCRSSRAVSPAPGRRSSAPATSRCRRFRTWRATTLPRTGRSRRSPTRTRSSTRWCSAPPASTSTMSRRCGSRPWCSPRAFARRSASRG